MMIKTTEEILEMCEEFHKNSKIKVKNNNVVFDDPRPLFYKEWVDKEELINKLLDLKNKNIRDNLPISTKKRMIGWNESIEVLMEYLGVDEE